ncbi:MAG: 4Fe-4S binding protein [Syntrophobacterales bacterium]|nr:4Fe-4S binding protein [Syntrophobacterales bacterium]
MKVMRKIIEIDEKRCDGCGQCAMACAEGAIAIIDGKARLVSESYCDGLGACIGECPQGAISIVEREAEDFDPEAVHQHLTSRESSESTLPCGCPLTHVKTFSSSFVKNWPVKIRLISPRAPFFEGARIFIAADCGPASCPSFHEKFLGESGVLLIGCPKFDNLNEYRERIGSILKAHPSIEEVTVIRMEVPCCSGLTGIVRRAAEDSGRPIEVKEVVLSAKGNVVQQSPVVIGAKIAL